MPKIGPCRPGMDAQRHTNSLFSCNVNGERHLKVQIKKATGMAGISPLLAPPGCATAYYLYKVDNLETASIP